MATLVQMKSLVRKYAATTFFGILTVGYGLYLWAASVLMPLPPETSLSNLISWSNAHSVQEVIIDTSTSRLTAQTTEGTYTVYFASGSIDSLITNLVQNDATVDVLPENIFRTYTEYLVISFLITLIACGKWADDRKAASRRVEQPAQTMRDKKTVAYHEAGHVLALELQEDTPAATHASIKRHANGALGATQWEAHWELPTKRAHEQKLVVLVAGMAAERLLLDDWTQAASDDLLQATKLAHAMIFECGMGNWLMTVDPAGPLAATAHGEVDQLLRLSLHRAQLLLEKHRATLERLAEALAKKQELSRDDIRAIMRR
jgi:ATP-dependent Zn protease